MPNPSGKDEMIRQQSRFAFKVCLFGTTTLLVGLSPSPAEARGAAKNKTDTAQKTGLQAIHRPSGPRYHRVKADVSEPVEQIIATGVRSGTRSVMKSVSPIEVVTGAQLSRTGNTNLIEAVSQLVPSVTTTPFGTGTGNLTDSIRLRGLNPDDTLVLINGKRRHGTANIQSNPGSQQGATAADIDMIPMSAVDHIEVLRDGAAAQYGSDAVAGVVNIILKSSDHGAHLSAQSGIDSAGDGYNFNLAADGGAKFLGNGSINLSGTVRYQDFTDRTGYDTRFNRKVEATLGTPQSTREAIGLNAKKPIFENEELYTFITYGHRSAASNQFYRLLPGFYPDGYQPIVTSNENDYAATVGVRGHRFMGFNWDLSSTYGSDRMNAGMTQSANPAIYSETGSTPTNFQLGDFINSQWTNNLDINRSVNIPLLAAPTNIAFGAEHRYENYRLLAGSPASYYNGGAAALPGLSPVDTGSFSRDVYAGYVDLDLHPVKHLETDLAGRFEHYTDVGNIETGKLSARYDFNPRVAVRGTVSTGFRAPTLAEENFANLGVSPSAASGQLAVNSTAARLLGATPLKGERSTNASGGLVITPIDRLHVAVDVYQINIRDRIVDGGTYSGNEAVSALQSAGFGIPSTIDPSAVSAQYFTNGASTRTQGLDITANYLTNLPKYGQVNWDLGIDLNRTRIHHIGTDRNGNPDLTAQGVAFLTTTTPRSKIIMSAHWMLDPVDVVLRETRWGSVTDNLQLTSGPNAFSTKIYVPVYQKPRWITHIEVGYRPVSRLRLAVGTDNPFNVYPTKVPFDTQLYGVTKYDYFASQIGFTGAYYYARADLSF